MPVTSTRIQLLAAALLGTACVDLEKKVPILYPEVCAPNRHEWVACTVDGDTIDLGACGDDEGERIRLLGAAAPEIAHGNDAAECYGDEAKAYLDSVVTSQQVELKFDIECTDIYQRTLAWVFIEVEADDAVARDLWALDMIDEESQAPYEVLVNELLIRGGFAKVFQGEVSKDVRYADRLDRAEEEAEAEGRGLWSACEEE